MTRLRLTSWRAVGAALIAVTAISVSGCAAASHPSSAAVGRLARAADQVPATVATDASRGPGTRHYLYVLLDQAMYIYDIDHGQRLVEHIRLPGIKEIRGVVASPRTHTLYLSYGPYTGPGGHGSLLAYDLISATVRWRRTYTRGVDSMAINPSGTRIYLPDGELSPDGVWSVIDARSGDVSGRIDGGRGPHNTIVGLNGRHVYLGPRNARYLDVASTATDRVLRRVGPLRGGVRPFTINGAGTLAYTTATGRLGFQVSSLRTGHVLYTVGFGRRFRYHPTASSPTAPSHGISLSPNERQLWVVDQPNGYVHVFDVSGVPGRAPRRIADIRLRHPFTGMQAGCTVDCGREGWLLHSRSGCFVYVGDSGDVIDTMTRRAVAFLPALRNTREFLEIDWRHGHPVATTSRSGLGHVGDGNVAARCR